MKTIKLFSYLVLTSILGSCATKINILGKDYKSTVICGNCDPGNSGKYMILKRPFNPQVSNISDERSIASEILGYVYPAEDITGSIKFVCSSNSSKSPFNKDLVTSLNSYDGAEIEYSKQKVLKIDVNTVVKADIDAIKIANPNISKQVLDDFSATLTSEYNTFSNKDVKITGRYSIMALDEAAISDLAKKINYSDCYNFIISPGKERRMITAIGIVKFDVKIEEKSINEIASNLDALAKSKSITFNIGASFKKTINSKLEMKTNNLYQVVAWRTIGIDYLKLQQK